MDHLCPLPDILCLHNISGIYYVNCLHVWIPRTNLSKHIIGTITKMKIVLTVAHLINRKTSLFTLLMKAACKKTNVIAKTLFKWQHSYIDAGDNENCLH